MKTPILILKTGLLSVCVLASLRAAPLISESFDTLPPPEKWKAAASASVKDGALTLTATGAAETYANAAFAMKAGDAGMDFTAKPVEIELRELDVGGTALPGDSVMVLIFSADTAGEGNSSSYIKLRIGDDGSVLLMCGAAGAKETTIHRLAAKLSFPVKSLKLRVSATEFSIKGMDATKEFSGAGKWTAEFNPAVWKGAAPQLMLRSVRRPGDGQAVVKVGALTVTNAP